MAFTGIGELTPAATRGAMSRLRQRIESILQSDYFTTQKVAGTAFAIRIVSAGIVFISQILLARWMGSYQFGSYVYVWTWLLMAGDIVHLGMPLTAQRFIPEYTETKSFDLLRGYLSGSRWLSFGAGAVFALLGGLAVYALDDRFDSELFLPFYFACLALPAYILTFMADSAARSYNWINLALMPAYIVRPVLLVAGIATLHFAGMKLSATTVLGVLAAAAWLSVVLQMLQLDRRLRAVVPRGPKRYEVRRWLTTALPMIVVWGLYTLLTSTDILVLKHYRPAHEVAHYFAAAKLLALISMIYFAVAASAAHRFTSYQVAGDRTGLAAFAASTVRWIFWLSLALALLIVAAGEPLLMLFGSEYVAAQPVMMILAVGMMARASVGPAERLLTMLGHQRICAWAYVAAFAFNFGVCVLLVPDYGTIGAAIATAGGFVVESIALFIIARRSLGLHMFIWRPAGALSSAMPLSNAFVATEAPTERSALDIPATWQAATISIERADAARLVTIDSEWRDLVARSHEPNVFMDPAILHLAGDSCVTLLAWSGDRKLMGVWAFAVAPHPVLPVSLLRSPAFPHAYLATPVLDRTLAHAAVIAMLDFIANDGALPKLVSLEPIGTDGPAMQALSVALADRNSAPCLLGEGKRPMLASDLDAKQYFEKALSSSSRKKLRQHRRRLEEQGKIENCVSASPADVALAFEDFLTLEAAGWKGRTGTALLCDQAQAAFARAMIAALAPRGDAWVHALRQNGKTLASQVVLRVGATAFTWKTAYDEALSGFSPGMLLLEDYTAAFLADPTIARVDSCSLDETGFMSAWSERAGIAHVLLDARPNGSLSFAAVASLFKAFLRVRALAKDLYLRGRRLWKRH